jgi:hypothetical protein
MKAFAALLVTVLTLAPLQVRAAEASFGNASSSTNASPTPAANSGRGMGVFCSVLMLGTFCTSTDGSGGPGYGAPSGASQSSPSTPRCIDGTPANELCN